jgi:hypothetical protein
MIIGTYKLYFEQRTQEYLVLKFDYRRIPKGGQGECVAKGTEEDIINFLLDNSTK